MMDAGQSGVVVDCKVGWVAFVVIEWKTLPRPLHSRDNPATVLGPYRTAGQNSIKDRPTLDGVGSQVKSEISDRRRFSGNFQWVSELGKQGLSLH